MGKAAKKPAKKLLLVGSTPDALEAKRVVLERAGYVVGVLAGGRSVRKAAEEMAASLVIIDTSAGLRPVRRNRQSSRGPDVRAALEEMSAARGGKAPSTIPVLVIGPGDVLDEFDGPGAALPKPAQKRALLDSTRTLVESFERAGPGEGARRKWSRRSRA